MSNPIAEGTKSLSEGLNQAREAGKNLTKSIEDIQHDGVEVARQELDALKRKKLIECKLLLDHGADPEYTNFDGKNALDYLKKNENQLQKHLFYD